MKMSDVSKKNKNWIILKSTARILFLLIITTLILNYDHANALDVVAALLCVFLVEWGPDFAKEII